MKEKYRKAYGEYREALNCGAYRYWDDFIITMMREYGPNVIYAVMVSYRLRYVHDRYNMPFYWRNGGVPF